MNSFFRKLKIKSKTILVKFFIKLSLMLNFPQLTAFILYLSLAKVNEKGEYKVLCLRRSIFMDDVRAMAQFSGKLHYVVVGREDFKLILFHFLGKENSKKVTQYNYHTSDIGNDGKEKYYQYVKKMFPILKKLIGFDALLYSNFCYIEGQGISRACKELKIPIIVLFKEGMVAPGSHKTWAKKAHEGFKFTQTKLLTYSEEILNSLLEAEIPGVSKEKSTAVGIPRMDHYFKHQDKSEKVKQIVLFSAYFYDKLSFLVKDKKEFKKITDRFDNFHKMVMGFAKNHPEIKVIIKTKVYDKFLKYVINIYEDNFKEKINNLTITNRINPVDLINDSQVVIGFGSTTLIEALAADKMIISFDFSDLIPDSSFDYFKEDSELVNYVKTKIDLENHILNWQKSNRNQEVRNRFLSKYIYKPDGNSSVRTEVEIINIIKDYYS